MSHSALWSAALLVAGVLLASGIGKILSPAEDAAAFEAMGIPVALRRRWLIRAHPLAEMLLGVALLTTWGWLDTVVAWVTLGLFVTYFVLIWRAHRRDEPVDCACFGGQTASTVTRLTVWRNAWFVSLAVVAVLVSGHPESTLAGLFRSTADALWVLAVLAAGLTALLIVPPRQATSTSPSPLPTQSDGGLTDGSTYSRTLTPHVPVTLADGTTIPLPQLAIKRAQLLVAVSKGCGACGETLVEIPRWRSMLPLVDIRPLYFGPEQEAEGAWSLWDPHGYVQTSLRLFQTPSAVLLGVDGLLAGGPEYGLDAIKELIEAMHVELRDATTRRSS